MTENVSVSWQEYYAKTGQRSPRPTLLYALDRFAEERDPEEQLKAVDLGCGSGRDTIELCRRGWAVLAIDAEASAIESLRARPDLPTDAMLETCVERFEDADWGEVNLVNAGFSLPLCPPQVFPDLWKRIFRSLRRGGRFAGQLYGDRDEWAGDPTLTHLTRAQIETLLADLELEYFEEEEDDAVTPRGKPKHWHIFHIVARKP